MLKFHADRFVCALNALQDLEGLPSDGAQLNASTWQYMTEHLDRLLNQLQQLHLNVTLKRAKLLRVTLENLPTSKNYDVHEYHLTLNT
jgi:hypothetical protein